MNPALVVLAIGIGYLLGAISFARVTLRVFGQRPVQDVELAVPGTEEKFHSTSVSATAVRLQLGPKYGCLASILDMAKAGVPALIWRLMFPAEPYFLISAAAAVFGHNWPVYYRFKGGRGQSPTMGGMLVIDPLGSGRHPGGGQRRGALHPAQRLPVDEFVDGAADPVVLDPHQQSGVLAVCHRHQCRFVGGVYSGVSRISARAARRRPANSRGRHPHDVRQSRAGPLGANHDAGETNIRLAEA